MENNRVKSTSPWPFTIVLLVLSLIGILNLMRLKASEVEKFKGPRVETPGPSITILLTPIKND